MRALWIFLAVLGLSVLLLTHLGARLPIGDAMAVIRPQILVLSLPVVLGLWLVKARGIATFVLLCVGVSTMFTWVDYRGNANGSSGAYSLYQKNLLWNGRSPALIVADITNQQPDFVTFQEVFTKNIDFIELLSEQYPYRKTCVTTGNGGIAILSKYPLSSPPLDCETGSGIVVARAQLPDGQHVWVASVHLNWPFPYDQAEQLASVVDGLQGLEGSIVVGGDFNMVPWGSPLNAIGKAARSERIGNYPTTFPKFGWFAPLAIDHVLIPNGQTGTIETRPRLGSDHFGLLARFSL